MVLQCAAAPPCNSTLQQHTAAAAPCIERIRLACVMCIAGIECLWRMHVGLRLWQVESDTCHQGLHSYRACTGSPLQTCIPSSYHYNLYDYIVPVLLSFCNP
eukprot:scpid25113/ scgid26389/ 